MSYKHYLLITLFSSMLSSFAWSADRVSAKEDIPQSIIGLSTYLGYMNNGDDSSAYYAGASVYAFFINGALELRSTKDGFDDDQQLQPYAGFGLGRYLQIQRGVDFGTTNRFRIVSEIAFDEWVDTRNHIILQGFIEQIDTSSDNDRRYGIALGYTF